MMAGLILYDDDLAGLKGTLQSLWAANAALVVLHPASRFYTGRVPDLTANDATAVTPMPYTRLAMPRGARDERTSDTNYTLQTLKFHVWTDTAEDADPIAEAIVDCYADVAFSYNNGKVIDTRYDGTAQRQITEPNYTAWETIVSFTMRIVRNRTN